jgi:pilus assembly protein CpaC
MRITAILGRRLIILLLLTAVPHLVWADELGPVRLLVGRSAVIDVGTPISRVSLTSSDVADAMVTSSQQLLVNGKMPGTISMFVWERTGAIHKYEIVVQRDLARLNEQMKTLFPGESIDAQSNGKSVVLSGTVANKDISDRATRVAAGYVDKVEEVVNLLRMQESQASNQVLLRVRFAEVSRSAMTELGVNLFTSPTGVKNTLGRVTTGQFTAPGFEDLKWTKANSDFGSAVTSAEGKFTFSDFLNLFLFSEKYDIGAMVRALQTKGLFQSLAEPNLVAESGKEASFLAGGEFPVPIAQGTGGNVAITVQYKEFGVRLNFTPTVTGNRVHLKVRPEVSTLDFANGVVLQGFRIPALTTRRTETELELIDGQTFAIAGLMNNSVNSTLQKIPGIGDIPILGNLFKSKAAQKNQTELVVMITPHILPRNSPGVTSTLPRTPETYMTPTPPKALHDVPPAAFTPGRGGDKTSPAAELAPAAGKPTPAVELPPVSDKPSPEVAPTAAPGGTSGARPLTGGEKKALERAQKQEALAKEAAVKAQAIDAKAQAKQAEIDQRKQKVDQEREAKVAREQAQRDAKVAEAAAVQAKKQAEIDAAEAKRQAELDKARRKTVDEALLKAKEAEAKYQAELSKKQK